MTMTAKRHGMHYILGSTFMYIYISQSFNKMSGAGIYTHRKSDSKIHEIVKSTDLAIQKLTPNSKANDLMSESQSLHLLNGQVMSWDRK